MLMNKDKYFLQFCIQCHNFQRRMIWQLSSILQQKNVDLNDILINISSLKNNGNPSTESIVDLFSKAGLNIEHTIFEDKDIFAKRGLLRNRNIQYSNAEWIFFADADNVYYETFFEDLFIYLKDEGKDVSNCITSIAKFHTNIEETNKLMDLTCLEIIENVWEKSNNISFIKKINKTVAAGCMQVVKRSNILDNKYVNRTHDYHLFKRGQKAFSDKQFRRKMGGTTIIDLPLQIHLNHKRDKEVGYHIEDQR
jgi:hypothetical protein